MSCCKSAPSTDAETVRDRAAACVACVGATATKCRVDRADLVARARSLNATCPLRRFPKDNKNWVGLPMLTRFKSVLRMAAAGRSVSHVLPHSAYHGCGCWRPLKRAVRAARKGLKMIARFTLLLVLVVGFTVLACANKPRSTTSLGKGTSAVQLSDVSGSISRSADKIKADAADIKTTAEDPAFVPEIGLPKIGAKADQISASAVDVGELAVKVQQLSVAVKDSEKRGDKLLQDNNRLSERVKELEGAMTTKLKIALGGVGLVALVLAAICAYLRNFWLAGLFVMIFGACFVGMKMLAWADWIAGGCLAFGALIVAWKLLADGAVLGRVVASVNRFKDKLTPELKQDFKSTVSAVQGPAVSRVVERIEKRIGQHVKK